jgi:hypothetical protein
MLTHGARLKYTDAVGQLGLPSRLTSRFVHALDCCLRSHASGAEVLRRVINDVAWLLYVRSGDASAATEQIREAVIAHLEERGIRGSCVLAVVPKPVVLAAEMAQLAAASLGVNSKLTASQRRGGRTALWLATASAVRDRLPRVDRTQQWRGDDANEEHPAKPEHDG